MISLPTLLLRLEAPLQSWGTQSAFGIRETGREPSKSGVVGLLAAALGRSRSSSIEDLAKLRMGVRVDREGTLLSDFQTAGGGRFGGKPYGVYKARGVPGETVVSTRWYLADACFLVALGSSDRSFLEDLLKALKNPVYPLYLGRRSCPPTDPLVLGIFDEGVETLLSTFPLQNLRKRKREEENFSRLAREGDPDKKEDESFCRLVLECDSDEGTPRMDVPLSFEPLHRLYSVRYVKNSRCSLPRER